MKDIILRKATLEQYPTYQKFYNDPEKSLIFGYGFPERYVYPSDKPTETIEVDKIQIDEDTEQVLKNYKNNYKDIFFIVLRDATTSRVIGYIETCKKKMERKITDIVIADNNAIDENYLSKMFECLLSETKAKKLYLLIFSSKLENLLKKIGFVKKSCYLEKAIGK